MDERRLAVADLGSNSFRLVVFSWVPGAWWKRTDEIYEPVRVGEGQAEGGGPLQPAPMERALETIELFAHFCRATGIRDVRPMATSAIREASNRDEFLRRVSVRSGLEVQVLSREEEARFGYLAAVNSTTLSDGVALDIGGGSMQLTRVSGRHATAAESWRLGAVVTTERFLPDPRVKPKQLKALRAHVREELASAPWVAPGAGDLAGVGGAIRNLAAAAMLAAGQPSYGVQGYRLERGALDALVAGLAGMTPAERRRFPGIKPERGDVILGAAVVVQSVMEIGGFSSLEVTDAGLREGVFFSVLLEDADPPLVEDVRRASVLNLAAQYHADMAHTNHVAALALHLWDEMAAAGAHPGAREERELLWAAAILHDIGMSVDYDDHHKHSRYLILNAGLPGYSPRETALIGQMARYHRKGEPTLGEFEPLARRGDDALLYRCAAALRVAEQLERPRDQSVRRLHVDHPDGRVELRLESDVDVTVPRWAAKREQDIFARAFGRDLEVVAT
ncbi:MAG TPA: Ppx/GppA phosphatase family protein [Solirubrobacteraceae bacterium]|nr:Ppx/GppA phosphatase family protein [Solirubrobacteraceae bacterium]